MYLGGDVAAAYLAIGILSRIIGLVDLIPEVGVLQEMSGTGAKGGKPCVDFSGRNSCILQLFPGLFLVVVASCNAPQVIQGDHSILSPVAPFSGIVVYVVVMIQVVDGLLFPGELRLICCLVLPYHCSGGRIRALRSAVSQAVSSP